jgi:zinc protease
MNTRKQTLSILLLFLSQLNVLVSQPYKPVFEKITLKSGLQVILHRDTTLPLVTLQMMYHAGSAKDPSTRMGLAGVAGEMLLTGTKRYPRETLLSLQQESNSAISGRTTVDWISITSTFPMSYLETFLMIEADRMENSAEAVSSTVLESIIKRLKSSYDLAAKRPLGSIESSIYHELYPEGYPYRHLSSGDPEHLTKTSTAEVRKFMQTFIIPSNASLVIGGNFDPAIVTALLQKHFISGPKALVKSKPLPPLPQLGQSIVIKEDDISTNDLLVIFPTVSVTDPDFPVLQILSKLLTGTATSRLEKHFKQQSSVPYSISSTQHSQELDGNFWISFSCKSETKLTDIYTQLMGILTSTAEDEIPDPEMSAARNIAEMEFLMPQENLAGEGGRCATMNLGNLYANNPLFFFNQAENYSYITSATIRQVLKKYFTTGNQLILSIVPFGKQAFGASQ